MNKPIMLRREDLILALARDINESGLAPVLIVPILEDMLSDARSSMQRQYEVEKAEYERMVRESMQQQNNQ